MTTNKLTQTFYRFLKEQRCSVEYKIERIGIILTAETLPQAFYMYQFGYDYVMELELDTDPIEHKLYWEYASRGYDYWESIHYKWIKHKRMMKWIC